MPDAVPGGYLNPVPAAVLGKATPLGLYYTGGDNNSDWGKAFTRDVGNLFERCVGRQLDLLPDAEIHPEILVKLSKKDSKKRSTSSLSSPTWSCWWR